MTSRHNWRQLLVRFMCAAGGLAWLLFVWRLWGQGDERWITALVGGPTTVFVGLVGVALVAEPMSSGDRGGTITALVVCLLVLASVLL